MPPLACDVLAGGASFSLSPLAGRGQGRGAVRTTDELRDRAKAMRREQTPAEARLWYSLRGGRFQGVKFARQVPIGRFIADFVARKQKLIIEVDGDTHAHSAEYDTARTRWLESAGYRVIRFTNGEVMGNEAGVLTIIAAALGTAPLPDPLPASGEREISGYPAA